MSQAALVTVPCLISRSAFSGERIIRITLPNGGEYVGAAPTHYSRLQDGASLDPNTPAPGEQVKGLVQGFQVANGGQLVRISLPDGETITIQADQPQPKAA